MDSEALLLVLLSCPILAMLVCLFGRVINQSRHHKILILIYAIATLIASCINYGIYTNKLDILDHAIYTWLVSGNLKINFGILLDPLNALMLWLVSSVSFMVHIYSLAYMESEVSYARYYGYLAFFVATMFLLIIADNFLQAFFAWELVGLASYLLIGFYIQQPQAANSAVKAFVINRISDLGFLLALGLLVINFNSLNYTEIITNLTNTTSNIAINKISGTGFSMSDVLAILLLLAALGKSAQIPFHLWLPAAMTGPIPVSALIHAATMVAAGVFMLARVLPIIAQSALTLELMILIGIISSIAIGLLAVAQRDLKQLLAYSTISQLGLMLIVLGFLQYQVAILHLVCHAFFKALLFLAAGLLIKQAGGNQELGDIAKYANKSKGLYIIMLIASCAAIGMPGFAGFFSKELILQTVSVDYAQYIYTLVIISNIITAVYITRMFVIIFHSQAKIKFNSVCYLISDSKAYDFALIVLGIGSVVAGYLMVNLIAGGLLSDTYYLADPQYLVKTAVPNLNSFALLGHSFTKLPLWLIILASGSCILFYKTNYKLTIVLRNMLSPIKTILLKHYWFEELNTLLVSSINLLACWFFKVVENWLIEQFFINGLVKSTNLIAIQIRKLHTGYLHHYVFFMLFGILLLLLSMILNFIGKI